MNADFLNSRDVSRQQQVGNLLKVHSKSRVLEAAALEFSEHGYSGATVGRIAKRAGVTVQTLYSAWGSKRELLHGYLESQLAGDFHEPGEFGDRFIGLGPNEVLETLAEVFTETAERASLGWRLYRDAAAIDSLIAADWIEFQKLRLATFGRLVSLIPNSSLKAGIRFEQARDTAWAIASPDVYELLVSQQNYSLKTFRDWLGTTLKASLLR
ncbi:MAG: TetR/AcrR family transcriptional regulator [Microbacteriaceae bacterium]|nr:TetR/AcrR family transcriptional regulator [Microbacteriaceae bacterium]